MTEPESLARPLERCWFCDGRIFRDEARRVVPGIGLIVHTRCYAAATEPSPPSSTSDD
jgi:hypothetical protein